MSLFKARIHGRQWFYARGDRGATAVEYGLMASLIALVIVVAVTAFGSSVKGLFESAVLNTPFFN
jgi:pilus assembly protein Flp/PilA